MSGLIISPALSKPIFAGISAGLLDRFVLGNTDMAQNAYFGVSTAVGTSLGQMLNSYVPNVLPDTAIFSGSTVSIRLADVGIDAGTAFLINRYLMKNDFNGDNIVMKLGVLVLADIISEYGSDFLAGNPLSYMT